MPRAELERMRRLLDERLGSVDDDGGTSDGGAA